MKSIVQHLNAFYAITSLQSLLRGCVQTWQKNFRQSPLPEDSAEN